jgi:hypothetical protein
MRRGLHGIYLSKRKPMADRQGSSDMSYLYWVAVCKTPGCENSRVLKSGGECVEGKKEEFQIKVPPKLIVECPVCSKSYEYDTSEIVAETKDYPPPPDFVDWF